MFDAFRKFWANSLIITSGDQTKKTVKRNTHTLIPLTKLSDSTETISKPFAGHLRQRSKLVPLTLKPMQKRKSNISHTSVQKIRITSQFVER